MFFFFLDSDIDAVINIIADRSNDQRQQISEKFKILYDKVPIACILKLFL